MKKYCIITFGCAQNIADSERIAASFEGRGYVKVDDWKKADIIVINTCVVRQQAEDRVYGLVRNINLYFKGELGVSKGVNKGMPKIIITGCLVGMAARDKTGKILARLRERMPEVDEFLPIEEVGFNLEPVRQDKENGLVVISNGCNNFCTFCVVPFSRGREVSRPYEDIIKECKNLKKNGYKSVMLLGQNVNSYGADIVRAIVETRHGASHDENRKKVQGVGVENQENGGETQHVASLQEKYELRTGVKPVMVKHLGRYRIPTLFSHLLQTVASLGFEKVDFMSSNPWDFSDELIDVISRNKNITRQIHLPVQSGSDDVLKRMNRWYSAQEYLALVKKLREKVGNKEALRQAQGDNNILRITTDIIVGFCGETEKEFKETVDLVKKIKFEKAYISIYSSRPMTGATIAMKDDVPYKTKKERWEKLDKMINHKYKILKP